MRRSEQRAGAVKKPLRTPLIGQMAQARRPL